MIPAKVKAEACWTLLFRISQKPNLPVIIFFIYIVLMKIMTNSLLEIMHCVHNLKISQLSASR